MKTIGQKIKEFLIWSQKYTRTDMLYLTRGGFWLSMGQAISAALGLVVAIAFANLVPKETYGLYRYALSVASILSIATLPQMGLSVTQAVARGHEAPLRQALRSKLRWGSLGTLASALVAVYYFLNGNRILADVFLVIAVFLPFFSAFYIYDSFLAGRKLFDVSAKYNLVYQSISVGAVVLTIVFTKDIILILTAYFSSRTITSAILYLRTLKKFRPNDHQDPKAESYGKHLTLIGVVTIVANYIDQVLVYHFLGAAQLAVYAMAAAAPNQMKAILGFIPDLMYPNYAKRDSREIRAGVMSKYVRLFIFGAVVVAAYILAAPLLFRIVLPKYPESVFYSQLYSLSLLNVTLTPASIYLMAKKKIKEQYYSGLLSAVFQIVIMVVFVVKWELLGLVIARIIARFAGSLLSLFYYHRLSPDSDEASPQPVAPG